MAYPSTLSKMRITVPGAQAPAAPTCLVETSGELAPGEHVPVPVLVAPSGVLLYVRMKMDTPPMTAWRESNLMSKEPVNPALVLNGLMAAGESALSCVAEACEQDWWSVNGPMVNAFQI